MHPHKTLIKAALVISSGALLFLASCSKSKDSIHVDKVTVEDALSLVIPNGGSASLSSFGSSGTIYNNNGVYRVENFRQTSGTFYWDFSDNDASNPVNFKIKFTGINNGDITSNDSLRFIDEPFANVVAADWAIASDPQSSPAGVNVIGMNTVTGTGIPALVSAYANNAGWYTYHWSAGHTVIPVAGRTLLWKNGSTIFKFEIHSIYQNMVIGGVFPYYTFIYQQL